MDAAGHLVCTGATYGETVLNLRGLNGREAGDLQVRASFAASTID
jgi:hypothetical protein